MLSKRRSSEACIQSYLKESATDSEAAFILGTGTFYKKGFGINNWKLRGYCVKGDKKVRGVNMIRNRNKVVPPFSVFPAVAVSEWHDIALIFVFALYLHLP